MKVTIVDMNSIEVFAELEDGRIISIPANTIKDSQVGDTLDFPQMNIPCSNNRSHSSTSLFSNLIDFF